MLNFDDYSTFRNFLKHIEGIIENYDSKIENIKNDLEVIDYAKDRLKKSLDLNGKINPSQLLDDVRYIYETLGYSFDEKQFLQIFALYHTFPDYAEYSQKFNETIENILDTINKYTGSLNTDLDRLVKINNIYKTCYDLLIGILPENEKTVPIDSDDKLINIFNIIKNNARLMDENIILMQFNKLNLEALIARNLRLQKEKIELEKLKVKKSLLRSKKGENVKVVSPKNIVQTLSEEDKKIIDEAQKILEENKQLFETEYSDEIIAGVEIANEGDLNFNYDIDSEMKVNLNIVVAHIDKLLSEEPVNFEKLRNAVKYYKEISMSLNEEVNSIVEFEQANAEEFNLIKLAIEEYNDALKMLDGVALSKIESIDYHKMTLDLTRPEGFADLDEFIKNIGFDLGIDFYLKFKILESIYKLFEEYSNKEGLESKKNDFDILAIALEEYRYLKEQERNSQISNEDAYENNDEYDQTSANNKLLFLMLDDGTNPVREYISKQNFEEADFELLDRAFSDLRNKSFEYLYLHSTKILERCKYKQKSRKYRCNNIRVIYINLSSVGDISLPKNKIYYIVYTAGLKHGELDMFSFAASPHVQNAITKFFIPIKKAMDEIDALEISEEEKEIKKEAYMEDLVSVNNENFTKSINSLRSGLSEDNGGRK